MLLGSKESEPIAETGGDIDSNANIAWKLGDDVVVEEWSPPALLCPELYFTWGRYRPRSFLCSKESIIGG